MNRVLTRPCGAHRSTFKGCAFAGRLLCGPYQRLIPLKAVRREIEPVSFGDIYVAMQERVATNGTLPKGDGRVLVESIRSLEQAQRVLALIARHVTSKREMAGALELDWPVRKKWLERICLMSLRIPNSKPLILDIFANAEVFALSTYFAAETVEMLAANGAEVALLVRLVELFRSQRPPGDKGVAAAYHRLLAVLRERKDEEAAKQASAALKKYLATPPPPAPESAVTPVAVPAAPSV